MIAYKFLVVFYFKMHQKTLYAFSLCHFHFAGNDIDWYIGRFVFSRLFPFFIQLGYYANDMSLYTYLLCFLCNVICLQQNRNHGEIFTRMGKENIWRRKFDNISCPGYCC